MSRPARPTWGLILTALALTAVLAGCSTTGSAATADPTKDKLAQIQARGTLVGYAELDYPPQSIRNEGVARATDTRCLPNQITAQEVTGFDIETTKLVADKLGVEACFVSPTFTEITTGHWTDRLDIAYGSGAINAARMEFLWMTQPYYYIPQVFVVRDDSPAQQPRDLDGKVIGTCSSCTVESYLQGTLQIPGVELVQKVEDPELAGFGAEAAGLEALESGELDAFLTSEPVAKEAIASGQRLRILDEAAFSMYPTGFVDKGSGLAVGAFVDRVNEIMRAAHADGTMKNLSMEWFNTDYTTQAGAFNLSLLEQEVK